MKTKVQGTSLYENSKNSSLPTKPLTSSGSDEDDDDDDDDVKCKRRRLLSISGSVS